MSIITRMYFSSQESDDQTHCSLGIVGSDIATSSCTGIKADSLFHENNNHDGVADFDTPQTGGILDIRCYVKQFEKDPKSWEHIKLKSSYHADDYDLISSEESFLFDKVILKNRIESGGLLVCNVRVF